MRFLRQEDFAILIMSELGRTYPKRVPVSEVARLHGISPLFLKKIVRRLRQAKLVESKEGVGGGYILARDPNLISLWDVTSAVSDGRHLDAPQSLNGGDCPLFQSCLPQRIKKIVSQKLRQSLNSVSLAQITGHLN